MPDEPILSPEQQWRAEMSAKLDRIEEMLKKLVAELVPPSRGLGH
jgi:hypothetical protein